MADGMPVEVTIHLGVYTGRAGCTGLQATTDGATPLNEACMRETRRA